MAASGGNTPGSFDVAHNALGGIVGLAIGATAGHQLQDKLASLSEPAFTIRQRGVRRCQELPRFMRSPGPRCLDSLTLW